MTAVTPTEVQYLNIAYFGRPADPASLGAWPASGITRDELVLQFAATGEYNTNTIVPNSVATPGGGRTVNETNLINTFYTRLFGRLAAASEVAGWTSALATGTVNRDYLGVTILNAALNLPAATEMRQVLVAKFDSAQLWTGDLYNDSVAAASYGTAESISDGITFLSTVTTGTAATSDAAAAAVDSMASTGGIAGGNAFAAVANNAVLTNGANTNAAGTGPGFTPTASTLGSVNDTIRLGVFNGATVADSSTSDNDVLILDQGSFVQTAATVAGIETINLNGALGFSVGQLNGVSTVNLNNASFLSAGASITTAVYNVNNSGFNAVGSAAGTLSAFSVNFNTAADAGSLAMARTTAVSATFVGANSYTLSSLVASGSLEANAGTANTFTLNVGGAGVFTGGATFSGANFTVNTLSQFNTLATVSANTGAANLISFQGGGVNTFSLNGVVGDTRISQHLTNFSGLDVLNIKTLTATSGFSAGLISANISFNLQDDAFTVNLGTTAVIAGITSFNGGVMSGGGNGNLNFSAQNASGASDVFTLNFNAQTAALTIESAAIRLAGGTAGTAAIETVNLNVIGASAGVTLINPLLAVSGLTTFNLSTTAVTTFTLSGAVMADLGSSFTTIGFTQADNIVNVTLGSQIARTAASVQGYTLNMGSGNDVIDVRNYIALTGANALATQMDDNGAQYNNISLSDGGSDRILVRLGGLAALSSFSKINVSGFGIGDTLQFTQAGGWQAVVTLTGISAASALSSDIGLFFNGTDTLVFANSAASAAGDMNSAFVGLLAGADYSNFARWNLNAGAGTVTLVN